MTTQPSPLASMRGNLLLWLGILAFALLAISHIRLLRKVNALSAERDVVQSARGSSAVQEANFRSERGEDAGVIHRYSNSAPNEAAIGHIPAGAQARLAALERRLEEVTMDARRVPVAPAVSEYDVTKPPPPDQEPSSTSDKSVRRDWGHEQSVGPPDAPTASDAVTAWASREADAGPEWLWLDFEKPMDVAEVRIRENHNPGAITKVTGIVNGQEVILWEGTAAGGSAPRDFVVPVTGNINSSSIIVHMDTARVPGWNEIDAVELVGRDGTRQWATGSNASSTYAEDGPPAEAASGDSSN